MKIFSMMVEASTYRICVGQSTTSGANDSFPSRPWILTLLDQNFYVELGHSRLPLTSHYCDSNTLKHETSNTETKRVEQLGAEPHLKLRQRRARALQAKVGLCDPLKMPGIRASCACLMAHRTDFRSHSTGSSMHRSRPAASVTLAAWPFGTWFLSVYSSEVRCKCGEMKRN